MKERVKRGKRTGKERREEMWREERKEEEGDKE